MACCLFDNEPLPEPMLTYCQLDPREWTSVKFESKYLMINMSSDKWRLFCSHLKFVNRTSGTQDDMEEIHSGGAHCNQMYWVTGSAISGFPCVIFL